MKIIGILGRLNKNDEGKDVIIINNNLKNIVINNNCIPLLIPPTNNNFKNSKDKITYNLSNHDQNVLKKMVDLCDGLIIPGGSSWYDYDVFVTEYALKKDIPILGICLGMQLLASIKNKKYSLKSIDTNIDHRQVNNKYVHDISILDNTKLNDILETHCIIVNSRHKCHIEKTNNYIVSAVSEDGLVEAIELKDKKFVIGIQWHPEDMYFYDDSAKKIFKYFFNYIKK